MANSFCISTSLTQSISGSVGVGWVTGAAEGAGAQREGEEWKTLSRVQNFPLVNSALRAYEQSKASSRVVKARRLLSVLFWSSEAD